MRWPASWSKDRKRLARNGLALASWYLTSTLLSLYNKRLFGEKYLNFRAPAAASAVHNLMQFSFSALLIHGVWRNKYAAFREKFSFFDWRSGYLAYVVPTAICTAADVALSNTSLKYISIATYVMVKNSTPIFVLFFSWLLGLERITPRLLLILSIILTGVCIAVEGEVSYTPYGFVCVTLASAFSGLRWALTQFLMRWHATRGSTAGGALATMYTLTPFSSLVLAVASAALEPRDTRILEGDAQLLSVLIATGFLSFAMILSEFLLIHGSSVLALSVAGLAKEIVLISASMLVFGDHLSVNNVVGLLVTMGGIAWFNQYRSTSAGKAAAAAGEITSRPGSPAYAMVATKPVEAEL
ncbi:hypothetical protein H9P43_000883 [Blastocladiella emersonii ATCC 22665]|nr:hypothetical protein H9P43_000883 [Blastocladiella emersonii ATCC 22665]